MAKPNITDKAKTVLEAVAAGKTNREEIATHLGVSVPTVNGSLTALKRHSLIKVGKNNITLTRAASDIVNAKKGQSRKVGITAAAPRNHRDGTKMAEAAKVFEKKFSGGRQQVLEAFMKQVGLTKAGAATYYQTLRTQSDNVPKKRGASKGATARGSRA